MITWVICFPPHVHWFSKSLVPGFVQEWFSKLLKLRIPDPRVRNLGHAKSNWDSSGRPSRASVSRISGLVLSDSADAGAVLGPGYQTADPNSALAHRRRRDSPQYSSAEWGETVVTRLGTDRQPLTQSGTGLRLAPLGNRRPVDHVGLRLKSRRLLLAWDPRAPPELGP